MLKDHTHLRTKLIKISFFRIDVLVLEINRPRIRNLEKVQATKKSALARTRSSNKTNNFRFLD